MGSASEQLESIPPQRALTTSELIALLNASYPFLDHNQRLDLFEAMCATFAPYFLSNGAFQLPACEIAERAGLHVLPANFYSPVANAHEIEAVSGSDLLGDEFGIVLDRNKQRNFLRSNIFPFARELADVPFETDKPNIFFWDNGMFNPQDACTYYGIIRAYKSNRVLEVGSGFSTLIAARAARKNENTCVQCVEPYPREFFSKHLISQDGYELIQKPVQEVDLSLFKELNAEDILFVDSSHVVKPGSDVEFLIFKVLPLLRSGVIVHFHDIFIPQRYNNEFYIRQRRHFNENYVLAAFLARNPEWEILVANAFISNFGKDDILDELAHKITGGNDFLSTRVRGLIDHGGSLWIRKQ